jgi:hypothetical protein
MYWSQPRWDEKVMEECQLVDVTMRCHQGKQLPNTYARSHRCLDYVLATEEVVAAVQYAGKKFPSIPNFLQTTDHTL